MNIFGIDEVGRGCWAGPLVAAAVRLNDPVDGLNDSKKLSALRRQQLVGEINKAGTVFVAEVSSKTIDEVGLSRGMKILCDELYNSLLGSSYDQIVIDGNVNYLEQEPRAVALIGADATTPAVMAASIIAKEYRDDFMRQCDREYPGYGFGRHVGYGTAEHKKALEQHGPTELHRMSYKPLSRYA